MLRGVYNRYRSKMYNNNHPRARMWEMKLYCFKVLHAHEVIDYRLKVDEDKLKMCTINYKMTTKYEQLDLVSQQRR